MDFGILADKLPLRPLERHAQQQKARAESLHSRAISEPQIEPTTFQPLARASSQRRPASQSGRTSDQYPSTSLITEVPKGDDWILKCKIKWNARVPPPQMRYPRRDDTFSQFTVPGGPAIIVYPLSASMRAMLSIDTIPEPDLATHIPRSLARLLTSGELLYRSNPTLPRLLIKVSPTVVVKIRPFLPQDETTEYTSMKYLTDYLPELPIPKPMGLIHIRKMAYLFVSYIPDPSLESLWPRLTHAQKSQVRDQLQQKLALLRSLRPPPGTLLGGVSGEGCADTRGTTRYSTEPIRSAAEFTDFLFTHDGNADASYVRFLRSFLPSDEEVKIVFTHGDLRPANILARRRADGSCVVTSLIDWENSGWYPEYFESMKATNLLAPMGGSDWYEFLPRDISPLQNRERWLVDRIWDRTAGT